jgi:hypothetical protein
MLGVDNDFNTEAKIEIQALNLERLDIVQDNQEACTKRKLMSN